MALSDTSAITVLNYNEFTLMIPTPHRTHVLDPSDDGVPTRATLSYSDVEFVNSQSNAFRTGLLFFKPEQQEEIYNALGIFEWKGILSNTDIQDMLLKPSVEKLNKLLGIKDNMTFGRIRGMMIKLKNSGRYDLSYKVINLIESRHKELQRNIYNTEIKLRPMDVAMDSIDSEEVISLKEKNEVMENQLKEMQKTIDQLAKSQKVKEDAAKDTSAPKTKVASKSPKAK